MSVLGNLLLTGLTNNLGAVSKAARTVIIEPGFKLGVHFRALDRLESLSY